MMPRRQDKARIVALLATAGPMPAAAIVEATGINPILCHGYLQQLHKEGMVRPDHGPTHRSPKIWSASPAGTEAVA